MIKVLIVDDSIFMRKIIKDMLEEEDDISVIGLAKNGKEAVEMNRELKPDLITLDVEMPVMNGLEALQIIMKENPTKVLMVSSLTQEGANETIESLNNGAFDFIPKPSGQISLDIRKIKEELIEKIRAAYQTDLSLLLKKDKQEKIKLSKFVKKTDINLIVKNEKTSPVSNGKDKVVAIGISTGGPRALQTLIPKLPSDLEAGVLIVQHMPPNFTKSLAERLDVLSEIRVKEAENGDIIKNGCAYIAPGDYHMIVKQENGVKVIKLNQEAPNTGHRPSANVLFKSVAEVYGKNSVGVIMTGMGGDGAESLKLIKDTGAKTIAQSKETCVVFGMPRVAIEKNAVDIIADIDDIHNKILQCLKN